MSIKAEIAAGLNYKHILKKVSKAKSRKVYYNYCRLGLMCSDENRQETILQIYFRSFRLHVCLFTVLSVQSVQLK